MTKITKLSELFAALEDGERVEFRKTADETWLVVDNLLGWSIGPLKENLYKFRIAPKLITITGPGGTYEYPEPLTELISGMNYYWADLDDCLMYSRAHAGWSETDDRHRLSVGLCHATKENAKAHAEALINAMGGEQ